MSGPSLLWRAILWVERFLPAPRTPPAVPSVADRRRAALVSPAILFAVVVPGILRRRHGIGGLVRDHHVALEQLMLVLAICIAVAAAGFGLKTWRDAAAAR